LLRHALRPLRCLPPLRCPKQHSYLKWLSAELRFFKLATLFKKSSANRRLCALGFAIHGAQRMNEESLAPASITSQDLREYKRYLMKAKSYRPSSINRKLATLKTFLNWLLFSPELGFSG